MGESVILYDDALTSHMHDGLFRPVESPDMRVSRGTGRGETWFIEHENQSWVLRHYFRGGVIGRLLKDQYLWLGEDRTRPFREYSLLEHLVQMNLPVPRPVAGRYVRHGPIYSADLITECLPAVQPLSSRLATEPLSAELWHSIGVMIGQFHICGVYHADLNAHNIQIDEQDNFYLLDFDRGRLMSGPGRWTSNNLDRLHRSLKKMDASATIAFQANDWQALLKGYRSSGKT
jgi:3-deoxy-D-manno-octulosonic acid kinase